MIEAGILDAAEPFELIGGELVAKMQKGIAHEALKQSLMEYWGEVRGRNKHVRFALECPLRLGIHDEPEPDFFVHPATIPLFEVKGSSVLLVVEVSDSSLRIDRTLKAQRYARFGIRDYWVVAARTRDVLVMREPTETGYAQRIEVPAEERIVPLHVPEFAVTMAELP